MTNIKFILCFLVSLNLFSAEVDHYVFMYDNQRDASTILNEKFNSMLAKSIKKQNKRKKCTKVVALAGKDFKKGTESKIGRWIRDTYLVDQRPRQVNGKGPPYYDISIYYAPKVPDIWPMTIYLRRPPLIIKFG